MIDKIKFFVTHKSLKQLQEETRSFNIHGIKK